MKQSPIAPTPGPPHPASAVLARPRSQAVAGARAAAGERAGLVVTGGRVTKTGAFSAMYDFALGLIREQDGTFSAIFTRHTRHRPRDHRAKFR